MRGKRIGFAMTGSFCTFERAFAQLEKLLLLGAQVTPIMSFNAANLDTRFGRASMWREKIEDACAEHIIDSIEGAEPIGPKALIDALLIAPCTGNTLAKLACGVTDTPVTMAAKSLLRIARPVVLAPSTNDGLAASAKNIGALLNRSCCYFVPFSQDDSENKPRSLVADFERIPETLELALKGKQIQPILP